MTFVVNGKFASQCVTGVQRVAYELAYALSQRAPPGGMSALWVPRNARPLQELQALRRVCGRGGGGALWEQLLLPLAARAQLLVSLCNLGPLFKRRHVVMIHDMALYDMPDGLSRIVRAGYRCAFALLRLNALHLMTVSSYSRERMIHHWGLPAARISVVSPAADHMGRIASEPATLARLGLQRQAYCLMVGSLDARKNLARVLAAINQVICPPGFKFVIVGGTHTGVFSAPSAPRTRCDAPSRVVWTGVVSDGELKALYEGARCFVFPSLYEGFGLAPLEAMYCGCPAIVSREAALPETCGDAALYCDAHSIDDIADKIELMLNDARLRERYRQRGLLHAHAWHWRDAAEQLCRTLAPFEHPRPTPSASARMDAAHPTRDETPAPTPAPTTTPATAPAQPWAETRRR
jgi:glycosyltransferase involved in cell wall biosynthesis